ncbi:HupE/UreJ family protein [Micromonospora sp. AMSO31t]|uniref:HupE/UreJ family protein n=1 Tax=Micromonospora sp. AMSO31t TaxID=2650566 RepID=UPI00124B70D3|nr:HupE/UreJ family protein [Micromonospora sp. AMSO31t]KAB1915703.1 HupE/UreJ family protein [Micromonospora sp. AMSO31t]
MRLLAFLAALVAVFLGAAPAQAHVRATSVAVDLRSNGEGVAAVVAMEYDVLARLLSLDGVLSQDVVRVDGPAAEAPTEVRRSSLDTHASDVAAYVGARLRLSRGSIGCTVEDDARVHLADSGAVRVALAYDCPASGALTVRSDIFRVSDGVIDDTTTLVAYNIDGRRGSTLLDTVRTSLTVGHTDLLSEIPRFVRLGAEHLLFGLDHVLFLLALLLGARRLRDVVEVATAFTVAHSVTLVLAAIGWVSVPGWIVEPLIALSIAFVALDNLLSPRTSHRLPVVFGFGLLHGLGFAGALSVDGPLSASTLADLVAFNVGIELVQLAIIALTFPALLFLRRVATKPVAARALTLGTVAATVVVAGAGLVWFVERSPLLA